MQEADHILIPLLDGTSCLAQVARVNPDRALIHVTNGRATLQTNVTPIPSADIVATLRVDRAALADTQWPVIGYDALPRGLTTSPSDLTDAEALDPAIVEAFASAQFGLFPWDGFADPAVFDALLRDRSSRPPLARMQSDFPKPDES